MPLDPMNVSPVRKLVSSFRVKSETGASSGCTDVTQTQVLLRHYPYTLSRSCLPEWSKPLHAAGGNVGARCANSNRCRWGPFTNTTTSFICVVIFNRIKKKSPDVVTMLTHCFIYPSPVIPSIRHCCRRPGLIGRFTKVYRLADASGSQSSVMVTHPRLTSTPLSWIGLPCAQSAAAYILVRHMLCPTTSCSVNGAC